jgi:hypothetical protein
MDSDGDGQKPRHASAVMNAGRQPVMTTRGNSLSKWQVTKTQLLMLRGEQPPQSHRTAR